MYLVGKFAQGKSILWHAAASSVSISGIQLSRADSASGVYATARQDSKCEFAVKELGADAAFNTTSQNWVEEVMKATDGKGVDIIVVRELIGGVYFGARKEAGADPQPDAAWDTMVYSVAEIQRITRVAAQIALAANPPLAVHSIDKANVLASSRLWRRVVSETLQAEYPQLALDHHLVDSASMLIVANPRKLNGVILTENLFGDM